MGTIEIDERKRLAIEVFHRTTEELLTDKECGSLYRILKTYQRERRVDDLVKGVLSVLRSRDKQRLLPYLRKIIPRVHIEEFDKLLLLFRSRSRNGSRDYIQVEDRRSLHGQKSGNYLQVADGRSLHSQRSERLFDDVSMTSEVEVIMIHKDPSSPNLGFSIRGGSEHGLGVYVSDVERGSVADVCGLEVGDKLLEVNNISFKNLASSSATKVLTGTNQLKLVVEKTGQVPEWRLSKEKTAWYDSHKQKLVRGDFEECGTTNFIRGLDVDVPERRVTLEDNGELGFNIRGGNEYGLGIYVSRVDNGGEAEEKGVRVGDQIVDVNGIPFENIPHANAVEILKSQSHLIMTLRDVGRYPAYKELYAEYTWSGRPPDSPRPGTSTNLTETRLQDIWIESEVNKKNPLLHRKVPVESLSHKSPSASHSDMYASFHRSDDLPLQSEIYLPKGQEMKQASNDDSDDDDFDSVVIDLWKTKESFQNPSYLPDSERRSSHTEKSETDDESGIYGEYAITMDDVISESNRNNKMTSVQKAKVNQKKKNVISTEYGERKEHHKDVLLEDEAVFIREQISRNEHSSVTDTDSDVKVSSPSQSRSRSTSPNPAPPKPKRTNLPSRDSGKDDSSDILPFRSMIDDLDSCSTYSEDSSYREKVKQYDTDSNVSKDSTIKQESNDENDQVRGKHDNRATALHQFIRSIPPPPIEPVPLDSPQQRKEPKSKEEAMTEYNMLPKSLNETDLFVHEDKASDMKRKSSEGFEVRTEETEDEELSVMQNFDDQINCIEQEQQQRDTTFTEKKNDIVEKADHVVLESKNVSENVDLKTTQGSSSSVSKQGANEKSGKWKAIKEKLKGSLRLKASIRAKLKRSRPFVSPKDFSRTAPTRIMHKTTMTTNSMKILEESAKKILSESELANMISHVKEYHESHDIDSLVDALLQLLIEPEKILLLRDIRGIVYPVDMYSFEQRVNRYEIEAYENLSTKLHLHLNHEKYRKPKKHLLHTEIDEHGHFYIKPTDQYEHEQRTKKKVIEIMSSQAGQEYEMTSMSSGSSCRQDSIKSEASSTSTSHDSSACDTVTAYISKNKPSLGLCVSGGIESKKQPQIKVEQIISGGAAEDITQIQQGMVILSIDGKSMVGVSHQVAVDALKTSFSNKRKVNMKIVLQRQPSTEL